MLSMPPIRTDAVKILHRLCAFKSGVGVALQSLYEVVKTVPQLVFIKTFDSSLLILCKIVEAVHDQANAM